MIQELLTAFILIFTAEMGDKTQILSMAFATKFPMKKVLLGIFLGSFLNHGIAVILGNYISNFIPINTIQIVAGFAFVGFSLWTLYSDDDEEKEEEEKSKFGPVKTVALAFFIGELGDKTQLTAITLATDATYPLFILFGTVLGMIVTGGIGIIIGKKLGDKIPKFSINIIAASVFMFFGISKLYQTLPNQYITLQNILLFAGIISILVFILLRISIKKRKQGRESLFRKKSRELYNYYQQAEKNINKICLGIHTCGKCKGNKCIVGFTKTLIKKGLEGNESLACDTFTPNNTELSKEYDEERVLETLTITLTILRKDPCNNNYENIHEIRKKLETMLFNKSIDNVNSWEEYQNCLSNIDKTSAIRIYEYLNY